MQWWLVGPYWMMLGGKPQLGSSIFTPLLTPLLAPLLNTLVISFFGPHTLIQFRI